MTKFIKMIFIFRESSLPDVMVFNKTYLTIAVINILQFSRSLGTYSAVGRFLVYEINNSIKVKSIIEI